MTAFLCYRNFWRNAFRFSTRASRAEFWWAWGINFMICVLLDVLFILMPQTGISMMVFALVTLVPTVSLWVRRLHDIGKSGGYVLLIFVPLIGPVMLIYWACMEGTCGPNTYGAVPNVEKKQ